MRPRRIVASASVPRLSAYCGFVNRDVLVRQHASVTHINVNAIERGRRSVIGDVKCCCGLSRMSVCHQPSDGHAHDVAVEVGFGRSDLISDNLQDICCVLRKH